MFDEKEIASLSEGLRTGPLTKSQSAQASSLMISLFTRMRELESLCRDTDRLRRDWVEQRNIAEAQTANAAQLKKERDQYASAAQQLILRIRHTAYHWSTTLPDTISTSEVTKALEKMFPPVPAPEGLRDDLWQKIVAAYYLRFESDGHPEDSTAAADEAMAVVRPELEALQALLAQHHNTQPANSKQETPTP